LKTTDYSDSNQRIIKKIRDDHFVSKLGEEACKIVLSEFATIEGPDYKIYTVKQKSWRDDLIVNEVGIAVKTQRRTAAKKYSLSWTFQAGSMRKDAILEKPDAWVAFVEYDDEHPYNCYVYPLYQIKELLFEDPKLARLKKQKKKVYVASLRL